MTQLKFDHTGCGKKFVTFDINTEKDFYLIKDRPRNSGLTSVRFLTNTQFVCADFNQRRIYFAELKEDGVDILSEIPTTTKDGTPVKTDLLDVNSEGLIVVSNFMEGTQSFYRIENNTLVFVDELDMNFKNYGNHGVRFMPGREDLLWCTYNGLNNKFVYINDYKNKNIVHKIEFDEQPQDVAFIGNYAIVPARTNHVCSVRGGNYLGDMYSTIYLLRLPENILEQSPVIVDKIHGEGHLDAMLEFNGKAYSANQYTDNVEIFGVSADEKIERHGYISGFNMPHGLDIRDDGLIAVTNYLDNTMRFLQL